MNFRPYEERDLEAMFVLDVACFDPPFRFSLENIRDFASARDAVAVVAEEKGKLHGFFIAERSGSSVYLVTLDVAPPHQRQGLGGELLRHAEQAFSGVLRMVLHVYVGNEAAIRFYEAKGYQRAGQAKSFYGYGRDGWIYTKALTPPSGKG
jgi:ribosomal-protein-alanine N-acetyltransferase